TSQRRTVWSQPAEANVLPSGLKATATTFFLCPSRRRTSLPVAGSHSPIVESAIPSATRVPSGEKAGRPWGPSFTRPVRSMGACAALVVVSHRHSSPDLALMLRPARVLLSGEKASVRIFPPAVGSRHSSLPVAVSHSRRTLPVNPLDVARTWPSGDSL